jgi:hypothetical protein
MTPVRVNVDAWGHTQSVQFAVQKCDDTGNGRMLAKWNYRRVPCWLPRARNPIRCWRGRMKKFKLNGRYFAACDEEGNPAQPAYANPKPEVPMVLLSRYRDSQDGRFISFFGDLHPSYSGNVVKAMSSAKQGYPVVSRVLERVKPASGSIGGAILCTTE